MGWRSVVTAMFVIAPVTVNAQVPSEGGYIVSQGGHEIAREAYRFDGRILESTMLVPSRGLVLTGHTEYDASLVPVRYRSSVQGLTDTAAVQTIEVSFAADSVRWVITGRGARTGATAITSPYDLLRNLAFSHLAVTLLRTYRVPGDSASYATWMPDGGVVIPVSVVLRGDSGEVDIQGTAVHIMTEGRWLRRIQIPAQGVSVEWRSHVDVGVAPQDTAGPTPPSTVNESPYVFRNGEIELDGTLTVPAQGAPPWPVGLIVAGSGPTDRNGNSGLGLRTDTYAQLAWRLAEHGIATVRYDKRGVGRSRGAFDPSQLTFDDVARDVVAGARALASDNRFGRVFVIGHSEGSALGIRAATVGAPVDGLVLLAGMGRSFTTVLRAQLAEQLDSTMMATFDSAWRRYLHGEPVGEVPEPLRILFAPVNQRFVRTSEAFVPAPALATLTIPTLIVQGETDVQVSVEDARLLAAADPGAKLVILPGVNHVLKAAPVRSRILQAATYTNPEMPIAPQVVQAIVDWIGALPRR